MPPQLVALLSSIPKNPNTCIGAAIYVIGKYGWKIVAIWWPSHTAQLQATGEIIAAVGVLFLGVAATDAGKSSQAHQETKAMVADLQDQLRQLRSDTAFLAKPTDASAPPPAK